MNFPSVLGRVCLPAIILLAWRAGILFLWALHFSKCSSLVFMVSPRVSSLPMVKSPQPWASLVSSPPTWAHRKKPLRATFGFLCPAYRGLPLTLLVDGMFFCSFLGFKWMLYLHPKKREFFLKAQSTRIHDISLKNKIHFRMFITNNTTKNGWKWKRRKKGHPPYSLACAKFIISKGQ